MKSIERFPFDWKTPIGYLMALSTEYLIGLLLTYSGVTLLNFSIGVYLMLISLSEDIQCDLQFFNDHANQNNKDKNSQIAKEFGELIHFHAEVIQLSDFNDFRLDTEN